MKPNAMLRGAMLGSYLLAYLYIQTFLVSSYGSTGYWALGFVLCFLLAGEALARALARSKSRLLPMAIFPQDEALRAGRQPASVATTKLTQASVTECSATTPQQSPMAEEPQVPTAAPAPAFISAEPMPYPKEATFWVICIIGIGVAQALYTFFIHHRPAVWGWNDQYDRGLILIYGNFWMHAMAAYWVLCRFGWLCRGKTSAWLVVDACNALVFFPFGGFFLRAKLFWQGVRRLWKQRLAHTAAKRPSSITVVILACFALLFFIALNLLRASDEVFADFLAQFSLQWQWKCSLPLGQVWWNFLLSLPVGAYFFSLFTRCMQPRQRPSALEAECVTPLRQAQKLRVVSPRTLAAVLCCFIGLYLLYFGVQAEHYLGAFWGNLPERFTFSQYARQGFFELCKLMALNFALLLGVAKASQVPLRTHTGLRSAAYGLMGTSLLFAATALAKLVLYIKVYGFTDLRLLSAWGIAVLVVAVVLAIQSIRRAQPTAAKLVYFAAGSFTLLCLLAT